MMRAMLLLLGLFALDAEAQTGFRKNLNTTLSEDDATAALLEESLDEFLAAARDRSFPESLVNPQQLDRHGFFFAGISGLGSREGFAAPLVLKSFEVKDRTYRITVAFNGERDGAPFVYKVVEFLAVPYKDAYRFACPFEERTADFRVTTVGDVDFHHSGPIDLDKAQSFSRFRESLVELTGTENSKLDYYCFQSLDELLTCYGFLYDVTKCNFLEHDLGFTDDGGRRYVTGTANESYIYGYVGDHLRDHLPHADELYGAFVSGMSTYYGGYALSGDTLADLKRQFRARLEEQPETDFLEEFRKGRKSSVNRHFSFYVMCAFLCEKAIAERGFQEALRLAYAGSDGARFFELLDSVLGVDESNFHDTILRLIAE